MTLTANLDKDIQHEHTNDIEHVCIGGATPKFLGGPNLRPMTDVVPAIYGLVTTLRLGTCRNLV